MIQLQPIGGVVYAGDPQVSASSSSGGVTYEDVWRAARMAFTNYPDLLEHIEQRDVYSGAASDPNDAAIRIAQEANRRGFTVEWHATNAEFQVFGYPDASSSSGNGSSSRVAQQTTNAAAGNADADAAAAWPVLLAAGVVAIGAAVWWMGR